jgi:hypothetical protein
MHIWRQFVVCLCLLLLSACGADSSRVDDPATSGAVSFQRDVRPLLEQHCASCHTPGGIAPFSLGYDASEWEDGAPSWAAAAVKAVEERRMPPWMPDPECHELAHSRRLPDKAVAVFSGWQKGDFARGSESDYQPPGAVDAVVLGEPDLALSPSESYTPNTKLADDYRCFVLPQAFDEESYVTATTVSPGVVHEVHHVILYAIEASDVAAAQALDAAEEGPGYTCFGGPLIGGAQNVGGWVPGMVANVAPEGTARVLPKGAQLIMQVHYNLSHTMEQGLHADRTTARLWLMKAGQKPEYRLTTFPLANLDIAIPAGEANSVQTRMLTAPIAGTLVGVLPHMHTRGTHIEVTLKRDEQEDMCLVRVPAWDFHWQQGYRYKEEAYVELARGDRLELTCVYDNSDNDKDVYWGEGTSDEMCLNYLEIRTPFVGKTLESECPTYHECVEECEGTVCMIGCTTATPECQACTGAGLAKCAVGRCQDEGLAFQACAGMCEGDSACVRANCAEVSLGFFACMEPHVRDGSCDSAFAGCGI